jgi:Mlc titration factor MtfA (ptsG expression regulator)
VTAAIAAILAVAAAVLAGLLLPPLVRRRRRRRAFDAGLPEPMRVAIKRNVPITRAMREAERARLEGLVAAFLGEKNFVGCNGLEVTDEIRATIAAQACLLLLGRGDALYDELQSILVYPSSFWVEDEVHDEDGLVTSRRRELSGEAWDSHRIILSWQDVAETAAGVAAAGYNVVVHEFAHYLDAEGLRLADRRTDPNAWRDSLGAQYRALCEAVDRDEETFLDPYAAEDEAEFFAVVTEEFFECPADLRAAHPELYGLMRAYFGTDPASWEPSDDGNR